MGTNIILGRLLSVTRCMGSSWIQGKLPGGLLTDNVKVCTNWFLKFILRTPTDSHAQGGCMEGHQGQHRQTDPRSEEHAQLSTAGHPVVFFCLDNSSFMGLKEDGSMAIISKCVEGDDGFHIVGELVVAPERALGHVHVQLKRAVDACGDHPVFIVTPWPRFARMPCCSDAGRVTNFNNADFLSTILGDLNKHKASLRKALPSADHHRRP